MNFNDFEFEKNKYFLKNQDLIDINIPKEKCAENCIEGDCDGFMYKGDNNKCLLFGNTKYTKKIDDNLLVNYNDIQSFIRTKDYLDNGNFDDLINYPKYYKQTNNYYKYQPDNLLMEYSVLNKTECMEKCVNMSPQCKSIIYLDQPKECIYSKEKIMKSSKENLPEYDIYTIKNKDIIKKTKKNKVPVQNNAIIDIETSTEIDLLIVEPSEDVQQKSIYSKCNTYEDTDNLLTMKEAYNKSCREEFGNDYIFDDNIFDTKTVIRCNENDTKKVKCKKDYFNEYTDADINTNLSMNADAGPDEGSDADPNPVPEKNYNMNIELFTNHNKYNNDKNDNNISYVLLFILLLIFFIIVFYGFYYK